MGQILVKADTRLIQGGSSAAVVVNVSERGRRWKEHDEAVKMGHFSRTKKPAKCDLNKNACAALVPGSWSPREETECPLR